MTSRTCSGSGASSTPQVRTYEQMRQLMELGRRVAPYLQGASEIWRPTSASVTRSRRRTHLARCMLRDDSCRRPRCPVR